MKYNPYSVVMDLFHAQAILGTISMRLPQFNKNYDKIREKLFNTSMQMIEIANLIDEIQESEG